MRHIVNQLSMYKSLSIITICSSLSISGLYGQSSHLPIGSEDYHTLDRLEALNGKFHKDLFLTQKGIRSRDVSDFVQSEVVADAFSNKNNTDYEYLNLLQNNTGEWKWPNGDGFIPTSKKMGPFYRQQKDFLATHHRRYYISANPILGYTALVEDANTDKALKQSYALGAKAAFRFEDWLSADVSYIYHNDQHIQPYQAYINNHGGFDGNTYALKNGERWQANQYRANLHLKLYKEYIGLSLGRDQHFIGDGYRSLMLGNFTTPSWYAKLTTKIWKFQYQNIYSIYQPQLSEQFSGVSEQKFATTHHLSVNVTPWLNIGLFESVIFGRKNHYEFGYLNPIIMYRAVERSIGSPDKMIIGVNAKALVGKTATIYGQFIINEFTAKEFFSNNGYWANKWGAQLGLKYFNAFTIPNLDIQLEGNAVRPYTYSSTLRASNELLTNYSHDNLPLAHPLGAGFVEGILKLKYRIGNYFIIDFTSLIYKQSVDVGTVNNGNNIFLDYKSRSHNYGVGITGVGNENQVVFSNNLNLSYRLFPNLYWDIGGNYRNVKFNYNESNEKVFSAYMGFRLNLNRRDYTQL